MLPATENGKRTILVLEANPDDTPQLRATEEIRIIADAHQRSTRRDDFRIEIKTSVTEKHFRRAIIDYKPHIVHVLGHGSASKGLVFENEGTNGTQLISTMALAGAFRLAQRLECVVLNVCCSELQAEEIGKYIPYVIGMNSLISDRAALKFAEGFFDSVFGGEDYVYCYKWGVNAIQSAGIPGHSTPRLKIKEHLTPSQVVVGRYCYLKIVEKPIQLGDTGFSVQRAHAQVWRILDLATCESMFIEQTIVNLRSDKDGFLRPYISEWIFREVKKEGTERTDGTIDTVADMKKIRRIGLDGYALDTHDEDLAKRFEEAKKSLLAVFPGGVAKWYENENGQLEKIIDYQDGKPPTTYRYEQLLEK